ncbi:three-helix bundle dimerization domain-containing protein [Microbacterium sp.]|uniref:three-helix bundle dimerization domain-containing protein n=1 Tax=Microbacterium sp. TaxID=51671 RepID=UPI003F6EBE69
MPDDKSVDEEKAIAEIADRLQERFPDASRESVVDAIEKSRATFADAKVRDFVPVLIEKEAKAHLKGKR